MEGGETYDEFPRPGDPNFTTFPKQLSEDTVKYSIHIVQEKDISPAQRRRRLNEVLVASKKLIKSLPKEFLWQRESFGLDFDSSGHSRLEGTTEFGDSISDEWLVVYLLRELSKQFDDAWIRVTDSDGEFLLIEAANALPKWLTPETAENRTWINKGLLRIISPSSRASEKPASKRPSKPISLEQAIEAIRKTPQDIVHDSKVEQEAFHRLKDYPSQIAASMHTARVTVPRALANILHRLPSSSCPAVDAFYLRDPVSMRPLQDHNQAVLKFPPKDLVTMSASFTRVSYAQLKSQEFSPPVVWAAHVTEHQAAGIERTETGMKLTCGFEMMLADPQNQDKRVVREISLLLDDVGNGDDTLPTDQEIKQWSQREDAEGWLDVNYEDFEKELSGQKTDSAANPGGAFGDKAAQEKLRRIVAQFESFLNDDDAGPEGVGSGDDSDDEENDEDDGAYDDEADNEPKTKEFDEKRFADMMQEMLSLDESSAHEGGFVEEIDSADEDEELDIEEIKKMTDAMEAELRASGALNLDEEEPASSGEKTLANSSGVVEDDDAKYALAKNILESFKSQSGRAGPAGTLMASMGINMPRDEEEDD